MNQDRDALGEEIINLVAKINSKTMSDKTSAFDSLMLKMVNGYASALAVEEDYIKVMSEMQGVSPEEIKTRLGVRKKELLREMREEAEAAKAKK
ncbi:MAG: hypothetical protein COW03_01025 [Cytophagales bacterium CG12_big_fil_rev_8_21_14_0_65_40_12]|nr:MAG: hypothetical protein COW03_01025 [Cytophagales bacterium CG12_big_fil_rev_8_21_14_0_65_40_12]